jgi:hypothetical protein
MRSFCTYLALLLILAGCDSHPPPSSPPTAALPPGLDSYFKLYCGYTGGMGIGFVADHTYDYRFRQHLRMTSDPELKRLFVLEHLHRDVDIALDDFEKGIVMTGKSASVPLTPAEWQGTREKIEAQINDLAVYSAFTRFSTVSDDSMIPSDPNLDTAWLEELRERLRSVTLDPAANKTGQEQPLPVPTQK